MSGMDRDIQIDKLHLKDGRVVIFKRPLETFVEYFGDDDYTADLPEFNIYAWGTSSYEAECELVEDLALLYVELMEEFDEKSLGRLPREWKKKFEELVDRVESNVV